MPASAIEPWAATIARSATTVSMGQHAPGAQTPCTFATGRAWRDAEKARQPPAKAVTAENAGKADTVD